MSEEQNSDNIEKVTSAENTQETPNQDISSESVTEQTTSPKEVVEQTSEDVTPEETPQSYEFENEENMIFEEFAMRLGVVAKLAVFTGIIGFIRSAFFINDGSFVNGIATLFIMGLLCFFIGICHFKASRAFLKIVTTEGDDIAFAMKAVNSLRLYYRALYGIAAVGVIIALGYTATIIFRSL
ncbi:hypothetical protein [Candidatus Uabimicrobium sp. HlEnr_7]|uniref:hypothetical protein n=1 Tax=Candidatus Uabimicrobium helgolandensis TaxID=3095367 RepID=UPI0035586A8D